MDTVETIDLIRNKSPLVSVNFQIQSTYQKNRQNPIIQICEPSNGNIYKQCIYLSKKYS